MLPVTFGIHKKQFFCPAPSEAGSETPEQQQDSNPRDAKSTPKKCLTLPLESIKEVLKKYKAASRGTPPKHSNSSKIRTHATQKAHRKSA